MTLSKFTKNPNEKGLFDKIQEIIETILSFATVAKTGSYNDLTDKPTVPGEQIQSDWNQTITTAKDYIKNKPTIPDAQVNSDWNAVSGKAQILNKPTLFSGSYNDLTNKPTIPAAQIQSDWAQTVTTALDYIKNKPTLFSGNYNDLTNKPTIPSAVTESTVSDWGFTKNAGTVTKVNNISPVNGNVTLSIPAAQIQADWNQTTASALDYIKNKPTIPSAVTESTVSGWGFTKFNGSYTSLTNVPSSFTPSAHNQASSTINALTSYSKSVSGGTGALSTSDTLNKALAKLENALDGKQASGNYLTSINSSMVISALGYTPYNSTNPNGYQANVLEGVQINGTDLSISSKKVNIPVASASTLGVGMANTAYGIYNYSNYLAISKASDDQISAKTNNFRPIVPSNLDLAVKTGIVSNSITLTSAEKTAAKTWLGVNDNSEIFVATFGTTTYQEISDALTAGKTIFCKTSSGDIYTYLGNSGTYNFSCVQTDNTLYLLKVNNSDVWTVQSMVIADNDLSNLSATGEAKFDAKVNKAGDTMTGDLYFSNCSTAILTPATKGTNPSEAIWRGIAFNDNTNDSEYANTRLGILEYYLDTNGGSHIYLRAYKNDKTITTNASLELAVDSSGNTSCLVNVTPADNDNSKKIATTEFVKKAALGNYVNVNTSIISTSTSLRGTSNLPYTLSLPSDGRKYLCLIWAELQVTATSGHNANIKVGSDICSAHSICKGVTRSNATFTASGATWVPVSSTHKIYISRASDWEANMTALVFGGYMRMGENS